MHKNVIRSTLATLFVAMVCFGDTLYTSAQLGYSIYLPDNWVVQVRSDSQEMFLDTTNLYTSYLSLIRYHRNAADFPAAEDWTRAYFIAYQIGVQYSFDPWGAVLYYDSLATTKIGSVWAPEAYTHFYSLDTTWGSWAEYQRFTAAGDYGYSLYAAGDTTDMATNIGLYAALLATVDIPGEENVTAVRPYATGRLVPAHTAVSPRILFDPLGRRVGAMKSASLRQMPSGIYINADRQKSGFIR